MTRNRIERLSVRCAPEPGEALQGYALRVAALNGYERLDWLLSAADLPRSFASSRCDLSRLANLVGRPAAELESLAAWPIPSRPGCVAFGALHVPKALVGLVRKRVCGSCMTTGSIIRRVWQLQPVLACSAHGTLLTDLCPACGEHLGFADLPASGCRCGWVVEGIAAARAPAKLVAIAELVGNLEAGRPPRIGSAPIGSLDGALRLLWLAATTASSGEWRSASMSKPNVASLVPMVEAGADVLLDWPDGLHSWLAARKRDGDGRVGIQAEFGPWLGRLTQVLRNSGCEAVADEARAWLAENWGRGLLKPTSFLSAGSHRAGCLTAGEAATRLGISPTQVARMVDRGELAAEVHRMGRRTLRRVDPDSVERVAAVASSTLDASAAAVSLGGTIKAVRAMRRLGLLVPIHPLADGRRVVRFTTACLDAAGAQLLAKAQPTPYPADGVRLADFPARRQVSIESILRAILDGHVQCWSTHFPLGEPVLRRLLVRLPEVAGTLRSGAGTLSVREAAKALRLSTRMVPVLVASGCLASASTRARGGLRKRTVDAASVADFKSRYILASELARQANTSTRSVSTRLRQMGFEPVVASDTASGISAVWLREGLDLNGFATSEVTHGRKRGPKSSSARQSGLCK